MILGQAYTATISTQYPSGSPLNADSLPTASIYRNGILTTTPVTISNIGTGVYTYSFTVDAGWSVGDVIDLHLSATVSLFPIVSVSNLSWTFASPTVEDKVDTILQYHDGITRFFAADGTTQVVQANAVRITTYDVDGVTPLKTIECRDALNNPVEIGFATGYIRIL